MRYRLITILMLFSMLLSAQAPAGYYQNAANKKGYALRCALYSIVKNHSSLSYSDLWGAFYTTDKNPANNKVWDIYSDNPNGNTAYYFNFGTDQCGNYSSEGDCYNREHSIPKSWFNDAAPMYTDLFHIYPTDGWVNNKRGNMPLGEVNNPSWSSTNGSKVGPCTTAGHSGTVFEPNDAYKGDLARSYFYFTVCYMDKNLGYEQSMFSGGSLQPWALAMLIRWHNEDPVSQKEIDRNNAIYAIQHNRNPFIDYPELVGKIFGSDSVNVFNPTGIDDWDISKCCQVYPNPARDKVSVVLSADVFAPVTFQLLNMMGQVMMQEIQESGDIHTLDVSALPEGIYILRAQTDKYHIHKKIIISH
ncbi:MAG: endonuclease [Bacteroidales bacterium]|nr:endonuclease [Bacteroidales bacterium]